MKRGKFVVKIGGRQVVKTKNGDIYCFETMGRNNRGFHGCDIIFAPTAGPHQGGQGNKQFIEVHDVKYPRDMTMVGIIKKRDGQLYFVSLDVKHCEMLVRDMCHDVYDEIKCQNEHKDYSHVVGSKIQSKFVEKFFFKAEFISWSAFEYAPYALLTAVLGPVFDETNYKKAALMNQGISQEMYPSSALR